VKIELVFDKDSGDMVYVNGEPCPMGEFARIHDRIMESLISRISSHVVSGRLPEIAWKKIEKI
jgi:hypothetical protein